MLYHWFLFLSTFRKNSFHLIDAEIFFKELQQRQLSDSCTPSVLSGLGENIWLLENRSSVLKEFPRLVVISILQICLALSLSDMMMYTTCLSKLWDFFLFVHLSEGKKILACCYIFSHKKCFYNERHHSKVCD